MPVIALVGCLLSMSQTAFAPYSRPTNIAHRGASAYAPEHTLPAYRLALEQGADFVEPDLQVTRDGALVCLHDTTLERTTDVKARFPSRATMVKGRATWPVAEFTLAEIKTLDAGSWLDGKWADTRVPTFQEMIDTVRGKAGIIPETKAPEVYGARGLDMEKLLMETLVRNRLDKPGADPKTPVIIQSFSEASLRKLRSDHACKLPLVFLFGSLGREKPAQAVDRIRRFADGIAPNVQVLNGAPMLADEAHKANMSVTVWTVRARSSTGAGEARAEMRRLIRDLKVDAIFTDNPDLFPRD